MFALQMRLNMTSSIPVDKPLCFPGPVPRFCEYSGGRYPGTRRSLLDKNEMIKIAGALTSITDERIRQIPGPETEGK
jgi:hypothetical protein